MKKIIIAVFALLLVPMVCRGETQWLKTADIRRAENVEGRKVELYVTSWCGYCKRMIRFLEERGIPFTLYDIESDSVAERTFRDLGGRGVPMVRIGSHVVRGYDPEAVLEYYNSAR